MDVDAQKQVIEFLSDPASYPGNVRRVDRIDTHASVVFLVGDDAFKMKRAVKYSYLDYSALESRRKFCEAEIGLNRRTAPELYEALVPVTRAGGALALGGNGEPVEWLVKMRRFEQDGLFDHMATSASLSPGEMERAAEQVARFHLGAAVHRDAAESVPIRRIVDDNAAELAAGAGNVFAPEALEQLNEASRRWADRLAPLMEERRERGFVRHCHGDLHLRNIVIYRGQPMLFDCIEFNDAFAIIDVFYDFAFLLMDLMHCGLEAHANRACNRYLQHTGDLGGLGALPLFLSCRAAIRAHVSVPAAAAQTDPAQAALLNAEARQYLSLALESLSPPPPSLVAVGGLSGTGKSALARALATKLGAAPGAVLLRSDVIRKRLLGVAETDRLGPDAYAPEVSARVYRALREEAAVALGSGHAVIADAVSAKPSERSSLAAVAGDAGASFVGLWLEATLDARAARVEARVDDASDADRDVVRSQERIDPGAIDWRRIDAGRDLAAVAKEATGSVPAALLRP